MERGRKLKILAVETTSPVLGAAVWENGRILGEYSLHSTKTHSQKLLPVVDALLSDCGYTVSEMDLFAVDLGPGSFTGVRIGAATVKGFAFAAGKPAVGCNSLEVLAMNLVSAEGALLCPIVDARGGACYTALYRAEHGGLKELLPPCAEDIEPFLKGTLSEYQEPILFLGDGIFAYRELIEKERGTSARFANGAAADFRAASLCALAQEKAERGETTDAARLTPIYLRKPQAQRELERRQEK